MAPTDSRARLLALWREIADLEAAQRLLEWDQETYMPPAAVAGRPAVLATLAGLKHARLSAPELGEAVAACAEDAAGDPEWQAQAREARRRIHRATAIPRRLAEELAAAASAGQAAWQQARREKRFELFAAPLARMVELKREQAQALAAGGSPYDALLDEHERGATEGELAPLFEALRERLVPLVATVRESGAVDESPAHGHFPVGAQRELGAWVAERLGFDFGGGRLDLSAHPFCLPVHRGDVRLTWRAQEDDFRPGLMGILHEVGHGLYEQGLPEGWLGTPLGEAASTGLHESQSRLWEVLVGRGRPFWTWLLPHFRRHFPQHRAELEPLWRSLNAIRSSLIRVEADAATYNLHIVVRFELERALFAGRLEVSELPAAWDDLYQEVLGVRPRDAAEGVLQDLHWSVGLFGYFPTYTLGTLAACQLFEAAARELGNLEEMLAAGELAQLLAWMRRRVHARGSLLAPGELLVEATGSPLSPEPFLAYLRHLVEEVYGVAAGR